MSRIYMSLSQRRKLKEKFNTSEGTITKAIQFKSRNKKGRAMRSYAVNHLGAVCLLNPR